MSITKVKEVVLPALEKFWAKIEVKINELNEKLENFEQTKSDLVSSALGKALGMTSTYTWAQVVSAIKGVATKTSGSQSVTTSGKWGISLNDGAWMYIPTNGYYNTAHWLNIPWNTIKSSLGTAAAGQVLSGYTFTSQNGIKLSGSMANKGALNWSGKNTTYSVPAGYYSGGTLDSRPSYNAGYTAGQSAFVYKSGTSKAASYDVWTTVTLGWQPRIILGYTNIQGIKSYMYSSVGISMNYAVDGKNGSSSSSHIKVSSTGFQWYACGNSNNGTLNYIAIR